jgi:prophage regulatory protein
MSIASCGLGHAQRIVLRKPEVTRRTGYSHQHIWRLERAGLFPARIQLGPRSVGWFEDEVDAWVRGRIRAGCQGPRFPSWKKRDRDPEDAADTAAPTG